MFTKRDAALWSAGLLLLAVAVVRLAVPDRSRLRPLSVEGLTIQASEVGTGETIEREARWEPPTDVYVLGWSYRLGAAAAGAELVLLDGETTILRTQGGDVALMDNPAFFQNTGAWLLRRGRPLTLRYRMTNTGPPGRTSGASALVYFVPVEGN